MSQDTIEHILGKAILDTDFRDTLLADPEQALSSFALTDQEKNYLRHMDAETLDQLADLYAVRSDQWK
jgi:hypothetical protein